MEKLVVAGNIFFRNHVLCDGPLVGAKLRDYGKVCTFDTPGGSKLVRRVARRS